MTGEMPGKHRHLDDTTTMGDDAMTATTTEQLKEQLDQAQVELIECLRNGADTAPIRANISRLEGELSQALAAEQAAASAQEAEEAQVIAEQAADIATEAHANIQARTEVEGLAELAGDQLPAVPRNPIVEDAAARVAAARAALAKAEAAQKPLKDEAVRLSQRLGVKRAAADKIRTRRAAGDEQPTDATDLGLLLADIEGLEPLVNEANRAARAADPAAQREVLTTATADLTRAEVKAAFNAAREAVVQAEAVFLRAFKNLLETGRAAGEGSPWAAWKASPDMRRAVTGQYVPGGTF